MTTTNPTPRTWQANYQASWRVQWLILDPAARVLAIVALSLDAAALLLTIGGETFCLLTPERVYGIITLPLFLIPFLTQALMICLIPLRVAGRTDRPYTQSFRTNDPTAFLYAILGPKLHPTIRAGELLLAVATIINVTLLFPHTPQPNTDSCPTNGFCTSTTTSLLPIFGILGIFLTLHLITFLGIVIEQHRATKTQPTGQPT